MKTLWNLISSILNSLHYINILFIFLQGLDLYIYTPATVGSIYTPATRRLDLYIYSCNGWIYTYIYTPATV